jgi:hypothetical protein
MTTKRSSIPKFGQAAASAPTTSAVGFSVKAAYSEQSFRALKDEEEHLLSGLNYEASLDLLNLPDMWTDSFLETISASLRKLEGRLANIRSHLFNPATRSDSESVGPNQAAAAKPKPRSHKRKPKPEFRADLHAAICLSRSCIDYDWYYLGKMLDLLSVPDAWTTEHLRRVFVALQVLQGRVALLRGKVEEGRFQVTGADLAKAEAAVLFPHGFDPDAVAEDAKWR